MASHSGLHEAVIAEAAFFLARSNGRAVGRVSAQIYTGRWTDVGTPERLAQLWSQPVKAYLAASGSPTCWACTDS